MLSVALDLILPNWKKNLSVHPREGLPLVTLEAPGRAGKSRGEEEKMVSPLLLEKSGWLQDLRSPVSVLLLRVLISYLNSTALCSPWRKPWAAPVQAAEEVVCSQIRQSKKNTA